MNVFTIETESNNIAVRASGKEANRVANAEQFQNEATLAKLVAKWPMARLIAILNSLPGEKPVQKVTDRKKATARIWNAVQSLLGTPDAPQTLDVAPTKPGLKKKATRAKKAPKPAHNAKGARTGSKTETVLALLRRKGGVTAKDLVAATGWQPHSVRGFISGTLGKKMGLAVESFRGEDNARTYRLPS